ncbi:MAG: hemolysin family protein [Myxococcota bacterium]
METVQRKADTDPARRTPTRSSLRTVSGEPATRPKPTAPARARGYIATLILIALLIPLVLISPWVLSVVLILSCAVYVAFEFALVKVPVRELEKDLEHGVPAAGLLIDMKREMNAMLAACQFGITLTSLGLTLALEPAIHHALEGSTALAAAAPALAMTVGAFFHVTFGELVPKGLALVVPLRVLYATAPFMRMFRVLAVPFIKTCNTIASFVVKAITGKHPDTDAHEDEEIEIDEALKVAQAEGQIGPNQLRLMKNVLTFADRTAREVMTPAREVILLDLTRSWEENFKLAEEHGYSRFPVVRGGSHDIVGYVRRAELLKAELQQKRNLAALIRPIERRPETAKLPLLNLFKGTPMIAVYDEHGSFSGLLTAEDVIEQIVGEVYDETDDIAPPPSFEPAADGSINVEGSALLDVASETLGLGDLDEEHQDVDTIGGLVLKKLGREPTVGDTVELGRYTATVEEAQGFRIKRLVLRPREEPSDEAGDDADGAAEDLT